MIIIRSLIVTLLTALTFACAANPPCESSTVWYEFSEVEFCFPKDSIARLNHLNMSEPAAEIEFKPLDMDAAFKVSFIHQPEDSGLNELSEQESWGQGKLQESWGHRKAAESWGQKLQKAGVRSLIFE